MPGVFKMRWVHHHSFEIFKARSKEDHFDLTQVRAHLVQRLGLVNLEKLLRRGEHGFALPSFVKWAPCQWRCIAIFNFQSTKLPNTVLENLSSRNSLLTFPCSDFNEEGCASLRWDQFRFHSKLCQNITSVQFWLIWPPALPTKSNIKLILSPIQVFSIILCQVGQRNLFWKHWRKRKHLHLNILSWRQLHYCILWISWFHVCSQILTASPFKMSVGQPAVFGCLRNQRGWQGETNKQTTQHNRKTSVTQKTNKCDVVKQ